MFFSPFFLAVFHGELNVSIMFCCQLAQRVYDEDVSGIVNKEAEKKVEEKVC